MNAIALVGAVETGLLFSLVALAVYLSFRVLEFPDLTIDGTFVLGAAVCARLITSGVPVFSNPFVATLLGFAAGCLAGLVTAALNVRLRIMHLLSGFLVMVALYSINLRVLGKPNIALFGSPTVFSGLRGLGIPNYVSAMLAALVLAFVVKLIIDYLLSTELGIAARAAGENPVMARANGVSTKAVTYAVIAVSNGLAALAGALFAQIEGAADVSMGTGTLLSGLAGLMIGETLLTGRSIFLATLGCIAGMVVYRLAVAFALNVDVLGLQAQDLSLATAVLVAAALSVSRFRVGKRAARGGGAPAAVSAFSAKG